MSCFFKRDGCARSGFFRNDPTPANGKVGFANIDPRFGDWRSNADGLGAIFQQFFIVELHAVCGLVLNPIPQCFEFFAV